MQKSITFSFKVCICCHSVAQSCLMLCDPMDYSLPGSPVHRDSPGKNTGVDCHALLQGIFPTQGLNPGLSHCRQILYSLNHPGSPFSNSVSQYLKGCWASWLLKKMENYSIIMSQVLWTFKDRMPRITEVSPCVVKITGQCLVSEETHQWEELVQVVSN